MKTLTDLIKIELVALTIAPKTSFNMNSYGGYIYIAGEKIALADYGTSTNEFIAALKKAKAAYYEKEMELEDACDSIMPEKYKPIVKAGLLKYIETL